MPRAGGGKARTGSRSAWYLRSAPSPGPIPCSGWRNSWLCSSRIYGEDGNLAPDPTQRSEPQSYLRKRNLPASNSAAHLNCFAAGRGCVVPGSRREVSNAALDDFPVEAALPGRRGCWAWRRIPSRSTAAEADGGTAGEGFGADPPNSSRWVPRIGLLMQNGRGDEVNKIRIVHRGRSRSCSRTGSTGTWLLTIHSLRRRLPRSGSAGPPARSPGRAEAASSISGSNALTLLGHKTDLVKGSLQQHPKVMVLARISRSWRAVGECYPHLSRDRSAKPCAVLLWP
jgi:hypothetical protein